MILATASAAAGGAVGATIAYRLARSAPANRATALLVVACAAGVVMGWIARIGATAHASPIGAFLSGACGTAVSFAALAWFIAGSTGSRIRTATTVAVIVAATVAAAMLGYLSSDLLGLAYIKLPRTG